MKVSFSSYGENKLSQADEEMNASAEIQVPFSQGVSLWPWMFS